LATAPYFLIEKVAFWFCSSIVSIYRSAVYVTPTIRLSYHKSLRSLFYSKLLSPHISMLRSLSLRCTYTRIFVALIMLVYCSLVVSYLLAVLISTRVLYRSLSLTLVFVCPPCLALIASTKCVLYSLRSLGTYLLGYECGRAITCTTYVGPKGPGKNEKISRCSWIFYNLRSFVF
jgi:hypothetical protein